MTEAIIDLRSDTVTRPTAGMRAAMAAAEVGDDVYGEDPTINALQERVAALFGHEAALFTPTGSMANQIGLQLLCPPASELLCDADAHVVTYEIGAAAAIGGISTRTWAPVGANIDVDTVAAMIRPAGYHAVATAALAVEQTHNRGGGGVIPLETLRSLRALADERGVALHCDGARIWHAHVADGVPFATYGALFDTVSVCLSKGLGAPVGSVLVSSAANIARARELRKRMGGGMRQAGILAAAGLYALDRPRRAARRRPRAGAPAGRGAGAVRRGGRRAGPHQHRRAGPVQDRGGRAGAGRRRTGAWSARLGARSGNRPADHPPGRGRRRHRPGGRRAHRSAAGLR